MTSPNSPSDGPPLRALAMVLIALGIVFGGLGAMSLSKSTANNSSAVVTPSVIPASGTANVPSASATATASASATATAAPTGTVDKSIPVRVLNNTTVSGLAARTADKLRAQGYNVTEVSNYSTGDIPKTTVYYSNSSGEKAEAEAIAQLLGASAQPRFAGIANASPGVIVILAGP
ncbi:LytR family transcriptional regulator [Skermania sp. ID1734]|uniref:LytR C-terminal domain-containing protein n=1 Tax=Skermania sp. ID1734 TaxID=2597516 RepID=UPI00117D48FE|nr:LytR C-terminal domain-containing protein [Skermania sp. ID1734]TSD99403.1 LytR family transcriptional regulator [Skermania sp. ID1734]